MKNLLKVALQRQTHLNIFFLLLSFPLGIGSFVAVVVLTVVPIAFIASPFLLLLLNTGVIQGDVTIGPLSFMNTYGFTILMAIVGVVVLFISLHVFNLLAYIFKLLVKLLLENNNMLK